MYFIFACWVGWSTRWEIKLREVGTSHPTIGTTHFWSKQMSLIPFVPLSADEYSKNYRNWNGSSILTFCPSLGLQHCWPVFCQRYVEIISSELQTFLKNFSMERVIFSGTLVEPAWLWESQSRMATPLGLEKFGRIDFSLARWVTEGKKHPNRWGNMPIELWDLSEFFFIHFCGRVSHFSKGHPSTCWKKY